MDKDFELAIKLLREFYYEKNGKEETISFLKEVLKILESKGE